MRLKNADTDHCIAVLYAVAAININPATRQALTTNSLPPIFFSILNLNQQCIWINGDSETI